MFTIMLQAHPFDVPDQLIYFVSTFIVICIHPWYKYKRSNGTYNLKAKWEDLSDDFFEHAIGEKSLSGQ